MKKLLLLLFVLTGVYANLSAITLTADAGPDQIGCAGQWASLNGTAQWGTPPYTYYWTPTNEVANPNLASVGTLPLGLGVHVFTLTVTDSTGAVATDSVIINVMPSPALSLTATNVSVCGGTDGSITAAVTGGTSPYTYSWSDFSNTPNQSNLSPGNYTLTLTDVNGCIAYATGTVSGSPGGLTASISSNNIDCAHPVSNATLTIHGGNPPYYIVWADGNTGNYPDSVIQHTYTQANEYWIGYWDSTGCTQVIIDTILHIGIQINSSLLQQPTCAQPNSGKIKVAAINGSNPYFFLWSNGSTTDSITGLSSGVYSVTVTDSTACTAIQSFLLNNSNGFSASAYGTSASCINSGLGNATIYVQGGTSPYTYLWGTTPQQTTQTATNIAEGAYSFTVTDNAGCSVVNHANVSFTSYSYYVYFNTVTEPNCGNNNGTITASAGGGTQPFTYQWNDNQTTATATGLGAGNYTVTLTDGGGCTATGSSYLSTSCYNTITGKVFNDINGNCVFDAGSDTYMDGISITASNGFITGYGYSDYQGNYSIDVHDTGTFSLQAYNSYENCGNLTPCGTSSVTFHSFNNTATRHYGFAGSSGFNLATHPGWSMANPGFQKEIWILPFDHSSTPYTGNVTVTFVYDSNLIYQNSLPPLPAHNAATHTLTWILPGVPHPEYDWNSRLRNFFMVPASLSLNYLLQSDFYISPTIGDCDSSDNHLHFSEIVTGSHDPNEKTVSPAGNIFEKDSVLTYSIHFQNSGNDTTWFVIVKDTLDANLDPSSVRNLASSHPYTEFNISGNGVLTWVFNPIYLVDSATNEEASKGFVMFRIKKKRNMPVGSTISNKAHIYFDYNEPVVTNTVADTISLIEYIFEVRGDDGISVKAFPNPFSDVTSIVVEGLKDKFNFELYDITGSLRKRISSVETSKFELQREELSPAVYFYRITTNAGKTAYGKLIVQ